MPPLSLSDSQLDTVLRAATPLPPDRRSAFLNTVAESLNGHEIGDGVVARVCAEQQKRYFDVPDLSGRGGSVSKYR